MQIEHSNISCGIDLLSGLYFDGPIRAKLIDALTNQYGQMCNEQFEEEDRGPAVSMILFSDVERGSGKEDWENPEACRSRTKELVKFITANRLGHVVVSRPILNPNSGRRIILYTWRVACNRVRELLREADAE